MQKQADTKKPRRKQNSVCVRLRVFVCVCVCVCVCIVCVVSVVSAWFESDRCSDS